MSKTRNWLNSALDRTHAWFFDPVPAHAMLIVRVSLGAVVFFGYLTRWPHLEVLYGPTGFAGHDFLARFPEAADVGWLMTFDFRLLQQIPSSEPIWALYLILLASSLAVMLGIRTRLFGVITLVIHILFVARNPGAMWGWGTMLQPFMLYVICGAHRQQWSVSQWWRARRDQAEAPVEWMMTAWPQRLFQIHITCAFLVLWSRFHEQSWLDGQALPYALMNRDWARFDIDFFPYFGLLEIASQMALVLEVGAPIALWIPQIRKYWALGLMGLFASLTITTSVGWWDFMMLTVLVFFLPTEWLVRLPWPAEGREAAKRA